MVDIHSHILWDIDDGAKSKEMTINMLKKAKSGGTSKIVATPHFFIGRYEKTFNEIKEAFEKIKTLAKEEDHAQRLRQDCRGTGCVPQEDYRNCHRGRRDGRSISLESPVLPDDEQTGLK